MVIHISSLLLVFPALIVGKSPRTFTSAEYHVFDINRIVFASANIMHTNTNGHKKSHRNITQFTIHCLHCFLYNSLIFITSYYMKMWNKRYLDPDSADSMHKHWDSILSGKRLPG